MAHTTTLTIEIEGADSDLVSNHISSCISDILHDVSSDLKYDGYTWDQIDVKGDKGNVIETVSAPVEEYRVYTTFVITARNADEAIDKVHDALTSATKSAKATKLAKELAGTFEVPDAEIW